MTRSRWAGVRTCWALAEACRAGGARQLAVQWLGPAPSFLVVEVAGPAAGRNGAGRTPRPGRARERARAEARVPAPVTAPGAMRVGPPEVIGREVAAEAAIAEAGVGRPAVLAIAPHKAMDAITGPVPLARGALAILTGPGRAVGGVGVARGPIAAGPAPVGEVRAARAVGAVAKAITRAVASVPAKDGPEEEAPGRARGTKVPSPSVGAAVWPVAVPTPTVAAVRAGRAASKKGLGPAVGPSLRAGPSAARKAVIAGAHVKALPVGAARALPPLAPMASPEAPAGPTAFQVTVIHGLEARRGAAAAKALMERARRDGAPIAVTASRIGLKRPPHPRQAAAAGISKTMPMASAIAFPRVR